MIKLASGGRLIKSRTKGFLISIIDPQNVVWCSGTTAGNFYYDPNHHGADWNWLMWNFVPVGNNCDAPYYRPATPQDNLSFLPPLPIEATT